MRHDEKICDLNVLAYYYTKTFSSSSFFNHKIVEEKYIG